MNKKIMKRLYIFFLLLCTGWVIMMDAVEMFVQGVGIPRDVKAIIFDLDGTIVTTEAAWEKAALSWLARRGIGKDHYAQHEKYFAHDLLGVTPKEWSNAIKKTFKIPLHEDDLFDQIRNELFHVHGDAISFIAGFQSFYTRMHAHKIPCAIATNSEEESVQRINRLMRLTDLFGTHIYNISHVSRGKPYPDLYLHAAQSLGVDPAHCVVFEDSAIGIQAAKSAGMYCIGITSAGIAEVVRHADATIDSYDEIKF